jgi:hypothetical protein
LLDFAHLLDGPVFVTIKKCHLIGFYFGFSQFVQYAVFAVLYYMGAVLQKWYFDDHPDDPNVKDYSE